MRQSIPMRSLIALSALTLLLALADSCARSGGAQTAE
jgi:hypothetical protein